ncbi:MAG: hypothetical protein IMZ61_05020 [Planctomycetes bacterium]|nr:hypothetical protein [Planctomycetota bacterium]
MTLLRIIIQLILVLILVGCPAAGSGRVPKIANDQETDVLESFMVDPVGNFDRVKAIENLCDRISLGYELKHVFSDARGPKRNFLDLLFSRHFQEVDERKIEIAIYLYKQLSGCYGEIVNKTRMVFCLQPAKFVRALEKDPEWQSMIEGLSLEWESFSPGLSQLSTSEFEGEVRDYAFLLHREWERKIKVVEAFIHDPVKNIDKIWTWNNLSYWFNKYAETLGKDAYAYSLIDDFLKEHFQEIDERKIEILIHLVARCGGGIISALIAEETAKIFWLHPEKFVKALERTDEWRRVIDGLSGGGPEYLSKALIKLGNTEFEKQLKNYVAERIKKMMLVTDYGLEGLRAY